MVPALDFRREERNLPLANAAAANDSQQSRRQAAKRPLILHSPIMALMSRRVSSKATLITPFGGRLQHSRWWFRRLLGRSRRAGLIWEVRRLEAEGSEGGQRLAQALRVSIGRPRSDEVPLAERIETERARIEASDREVRWKEGKPASVAMIARRGSVPRRDGVFLLKLVRAFAPRRGLELGTCVGVSAAYQAAGMQLNGFGELITLEGNRDLADQAHEFWRGVRLDNVTAVVGRFQHSLPGVLASNRVDYAFVDGSHHEAATIEYFERIAARANPGAVLVFDDITWSPSMLRAWERIRQDPLTAAHAAIGRFGVVVLSPTIAVDAAE